MKTIFEKWFDNGTKCIELISYDNWKRHPQFLIHENGGRKKNGDSCFDFNINFFYLHFSYTNFDLQNHRNHKSECCINCKHFEKDYIRINNYVYPCQLGGTKYRCDKFERKDKNPGDIK